jgi:hypothetical protein
MTKAAAYSILSIIIALITAGCNRDLTGRYSMAKLSPNALSFTFNKDSTFCLKGWFEIGGEDEICGKWKLKNDTISLFENAGTTNNKNLAVTFNESKMDSAKIKFIVRDADNEPLVGAILLINGRPEKHITNKKGIFEAAYFEVNKIEIDYIGIGKHQFISKLGSNMFLINVDFQKMPKLKYLTLPGKLLIKGKTLFTLINDTIAPGSKFYKISVPIKKQH